MLACAALVVYLVTSYIHKSPEWTLKTFWQPASVSTKPVLICLPRPIVYRPSEKLYDEYEKTHPDAFVTREARRNQILPLAPTDTIHWGDMTPVRNSGPGIGAVVAAVNVGKLLAEQGVRFELRFGEEATYADMRDSPVVIVGAINTDWATQLTSESHFVFDETRGSPNIHETAGARRIWQMESSDSNITRDYGLITRQLSGKAGQFLVQIAGISHFGTEAASEFLANKKEFYKKRCMQNRSASKKKTFRSLSRPTSRLEGQGRRTLWPSVVGNSVDDQSKAGGGNITHGPPLWWISRDCSRSCVGLDPKDSGAGGNTAVSATKRNP